jgi:tetratricopeptide (TPR) repeat protein
MNSLIRSRSECGWLCGLWLVLWALGPLPAAGTELSEQAQSQARQKYTEGNTAYAQGDFHQALVDFTQAYQLAPLPGFLFNVAQCHRQLGAFERAAFYYRRYLALSEKEPANAPMVKGLIAEMDARASKEAAGRAARDKAQAKAAAIKTPEPRGEPRRERSALKDAERRALDIHTSRSLSEQPATLPPAAVPGGPEPQPVHESLARKWWVWAGAGAVVLLAGGAVYAATSHDSRTATLGTFPAR